jgi:hypothetical protein
MDLSSVSEGAAVMSAMSGANAAKYAVAVMGLAQRERKQEAASLISLIQTAAPKEGVGGNLSVYA